VSARQLELATASRAKEKQLLVQLRAYFKQEPLKSITANRITDYRTWRAAQGVGPATLNAELGILRRVLKRAKLWARVADDIRPLKEPSTIGRALTEDDKQRLLKTAVIRPEWETAYLAAILCLNTTARGCELKGLQWADVDLFFRALTIRKSKTDAGVRVVPLTDVAASALASCVAERSPSALSSRRITSSRPLFRSSPSAVTRSSDTTSQRLTQRHTSKAGGQLGAP
jgi:integrase